MRLLMWIVSQALRLTPPAAVVVVSSPMLEGNGSEIVRWLDAHYSGRTVWLIEGRSWPGADRWLLGPDHGVDIRLKRPVAALRAYLRAEAVFFTNSVLMGIALVPRRVFVNLWHGDGPKVTAPSQPSPSNLLVAGSSVWGMAKAEAFGTPLDDLIVTGNPRIDQYQRPTTDESLRRLGLDPARPVILWAPTFRHTRADADVDVRDTPDAFAFAELAARSELLEAATRASGAQIVVKPHPLDAATYDLPGVQTVTDTDLVAAQSGLYQLMARCAALITDYSSIWTDYLPLGRPVGFYCPDMAEYEAGRGFSRAGFSEVLPGPILGSVEALATFIEAVVTTPELGRELRSASAAKLGIVSELGATARVMAEVGGRFPVRGLGAT